MRTPSSPAASLFGFDPRTRSSGWLAVALLPYAVLAFTTVQSPGVVGEVALGWRSGPPVDVRVELDSPPPEDRLGPLRARQTRPIERVEVGPVHAPLAINTYTGGLPDWPARMVHTLTESTAAVRALHLLMGAGILAALFTFLRRHASLAAAVAATLVLGSRWDFVFYRSVLGGTEVVLVAATLATVWTLWQRRWRGQSHGVAAIALSVGVGLHAKLTFVVVAVAVALSALLLRADRPPMGPPRAASPLRTIAALVGPLLPLAVANLHQARLGPPRLHSHDHLGLQLARVAGALQGQQAPTRESLGNIVAWLGDPLGFLGRAYGVAPLPDAPWLLVGLGWVTVLVGVGLVVRNRHATPRDALLRFSTVTLVLGVVGLLVVARDLHHLATMSVVLAMVVGLAADQLAATRYHRRSVRQTLAAMVLVSPWVLTGGMQLARTDAVVSRVAVPTFRADGQAALARLLHVGGVQAVWVSDYESMGALELALAAHGPPHIEVHHAWGAASMRARGDAAAFLPGLLVAASGAHLLVVEASAPMIYNLRARGRSLERAAEQAGVRLEEVGRLDDDSAALYRVEPVGG